MALIREHTLPGAVRGSFFVCKVFGGDRLRFVSAVRQGHDTAKAAYAAFAVFKRFYRGNEKNLLQIALHCFFVLKFNQFAEI